MVRAILSFVNPALNRTFREVQIGSSLVAASASEWNAQPNAVHSLALAATKRWGPAHPGIRRRTCGPERSWQPRIFSRLWFPFLPLRSHEVFGLVTHVIEHGRVARELLNPRLSIQLRVESTFQQPDRE